MPIGTPAAEAERRLVAALGRPTDRWALPDCGGETGVYLRWGPLGVVLSDEAVAGAPVRLSGWELDTGRPRHRYALPYGVGIGTPLREALRRVPGAQGAYVQETADAFYVWTERTDDPSWRGSTRDDSGSVAGISFRGFGCD